MKISPEDVKQVADSINVELTEAEIKEVIERYPSEQEEDPTGTWNLVIDHIIQCIIDDRERRF